MPNVLIDIILVNAVVPSRIPDVEADAIRRTLQGPEFMTRLGRAIRAVVGQQPSLGKLRLALTR